jgi:hypothetical protein
MANRWLEHLQKVYQAHKEKGMTYKEAMSEAKKTYNK